MSEPTIKPAFGPCPGAGRFRPMRSHAGNIVGFECANCGACPMETISSPYEMENACPKRARHYTHDDLVAVARACCAMWDESTAFDDEQAEAETVVERLTGVKR